jgi:hypothetical protein
MRASDQQVNTTVADTHQNTPLRRATASTLAGIKTTLGQCQRPHSAQLHASGMPDRPYFVGGSAEGAVSLTLAKSGHGHCNLLT